jgi:thiol-disulfide isomerase/thioredoxin
VNAGPGASPARAWVAGLAVIAAAGVAGFLLHRLSSRTPGLYPRSAAPEAAAHPGAAVAPEGTPSYPARRIPDEVPPVTLPGLDGRPHALADYRGRLLVVNFWATWCEPCRREIPLLKSLRTEYAQDGLEIVGIAVDSRDVVAKYASAHGMAYPVLLGEQGGLEAASAFGMEVVLPFSVFADRAGRIVALKVGELRPDEAHAILAGLRDLDAGHLTLKAAQSQIAARLSALEARHAAAAGADGN